MTKESWFSAKLRKICLIEGSKATLAMDSIYLLRAKNFAGALAKAMDLGAASEEEYRNEAGKKVIWKFAKVLTLDIINQENLEYAEIHCDLVDLESHEQFDFDSKFSPKDSQPDQTL